MSDKEDVLVIQNFIDSLTGVETRAVEAVFGAPFEIFRTMAARPKSYDEHMVAYFFGTMPSAAGPALYKAVGMKAWPLIKLGLGLRLKYEARPGPGRDGGAPGGGSGAASPRH